MAAATASGARGAPVASRPVAALPAASPTGSAVPFQVNASVVVPAGPSSPTRALESATAGAIGTLPRSTTAPSHHGEGAKSQESIPAASAARSSAGRAGEAWRPSSSIRSV
jgi:hypothetical protein